MEQPHKMTQNQRRLEELRSQVEEKRTRLRQLLTRLELVEAMSPSREQAKKAIEA